MTVYKALIPNDTRGAKLSTAIIVMTKRPRHIV